MVGAAGRLGGAATLVPVDFVCGDLAVSGGVAGPVAESETADAAESGVGTESAGVATAQAFVVSSATVGSAPERMKASTGAQSQGRVETSSAECPLRQ